jgi:hypothetical protein
VTDQLDSDIIQIDRDGPSFNFVLNYLRDILKATNPVVPIIPNTLSALAILREDVIFYGLDALLEAIDLKLERFTEITLNVGGQNFLTHLNTMLIYPDSRLAELVSDAFFNDNQTNIFIDRDNTTFETILNFLNSRDTFDYSDPAFEKPVIIPMDVCLRQRLLRELEYYQIQPLQNKVKSLLNNNVYQIRSKFYKIPFNENWIDYTKSIVQGNQNLLDEQSQNGLTLMSTVSYESQITQTTKMRYYEFTFRDPDVESEI